MCFDTAASVITIRRAMAASGPFLGHEPEHLPLRGSAAPAEPGGQGRGPCVDASVTVAMPDGPAYRGWVAGRMLWVKRKRLSGS